MSMHSSTLNLYSVFRYRNATVVPVGVSLVRSGPVCKKKGKMRAIVGDLYIYVPRHDHRVVLSARKEEYIVGQGLHNHRARSRR